MSQPAQPTVACPKCRGRQPERGPDAIYYCDDCRCQFDSDPDEGGDYSDRDHSLRLQRAEEQRIRNQNRTRARRGKR